PSNYDKLPPEEQEMRSALHICRYLADNTGALLILDNVEKPELAATVISDLVGKIARCAILYTSRYSFTPYPSVRICMVDKLTEDNALSLLLEYKPALLSNPDTDKIVVELQAARKICTLCRPFATCTYAASQSFARSLSDVRSFI
ncbi:MAG: hypothetical protein ACHQX1_03590, partial [Candidatus Micrarchaeales archaeon]